ncbi:MAG: AAA family ATPase [Acholeplasmataceae bacterium]|nr:AAA family ATPase [Acholeplasmataceae bacterium]
MIKKIDRIQNFGSYQNYSWDCKNDFSHFNLIFGWNYSGKTTLSRIFRSFEKYELPEHYESGSFKITCSDGTEYTQKSLSTPLSIRVFNEDFVEENFHWKEDASAEPFFILGKKNFELSEELNEKKTECEKLLREINQTIKKLEDQTTTLEETYTNKARDIKQNLNIPDYDKTKLKKVVGEIRDDEQSHILDEKSLSSTLYTYQYTDKRDEIPQLSLEIPDLQSLVSEIREIASEIIDTQPIQKLVEDPKLNEWVREGVNLHKNDDSVCKFCGQPLPPETLKRYLEHFSDNYNSFMSKVREYKERVSQLRINLNSVKIPEKIFFYQNISDTDFAELSSLSLLKQEYENYLNYLIKIADEKINNIFTRLPVREIEFDQFEFERHISIVNQLIAKNNERTQHFETEIEKSKEILLKHYAGEFIKDSNLKQVDVETSTLRLSLKTMENQRKRLKKEITELSVQFEEGKIGAEKINQYLETYFGKGDIIIRSEGDTGGFQLYRGKQKAYNLSSGEKTSIAFAYFLAKLREKNTIFDNSIVYIDDPVSSLDSRHLFNTYSLIKTIFHGEQEHPCKCKQLFLSTHNYEFLCLSLEWFKKIPKSSKSTAYYLIQKSERESCDESVIIDMPKTLTKKNAEYGYLFEQLYNYHINPSEELDRSYCLPNMTRRFLESYCSFKYRSDLGEGVIKLIPDIQKRERVLKYTNYYSHLTDYVHTIGMADLSEGKDVIGIIFEAMNQSDPDHYIALENEVRSNQPPSR